MKQDSFKDYVLDQLQGMESVTPRAMFGGYGLYCGDVFFGILHQGRLYFKTNDQTRPAYVEVGMQPFSPSDKQTLKNYYEVPPDVLEDGEQLVAWAASAARIAPEPI